MPHPTKETVSFQIDIDKRAALDQIAEAQERDRSHIIREAIDTYINLQNWQTDHIRGGLRHAEAGQIVDHAQVKAWVGSLGSKKELPRPTASKGKRRA
jgi:predicted transcriptional regulator